MTKKEERQLIYDKYGGKCSYCGCDLKKGWHADHLIPIKRKLEWGKDKHGNHIIVTSNECERPKFNTIENKVPSCHSCNIMKHSLSLESFRSSVEYFITSLNNNSNPYKFAKKYGLIKETNNKVVFYFETL